ncbi:MAG TPA: hybrid sensor histidine kinase/response regulator [Polyangiaceae bacterium]|nr:hybrid sensor histidine kinase/response regulator [Polyangiaceae bacterium]
MTITSRQPVKFLIVDDLEENVLVLESLLGRPGLEMLKASSGREALELLLMHDVALALIDVQMPDMDGFELAELMRGSERTKHVPIIFVTAGVREQKRVFRGYDAGAVDFLFKPIDPQILRHKTETFFQLYRQRQALAATLRLNEELMAVVGHDLRNPVNVVLMTAEMLERRTDDPETRKAILRLKSSGRRMVQIIDELFDLTRARLSGGIPIERAPADALSIARAAVAEFEATNPKRVIKLVHEGDTRGEWDAVRVAQVLSNLIGNALRHGVPDQPVVVSLCGTETDIVISIHNGGHIPKAILPTLFEPFQSGPGPSKRAQGLGLGLYIVQQIAISHAGSVEVESDSDKGTTFTVRLPRRAPPSSPTSRPPPFA